MKEGEPLNNGEKRNDFRLVRRASGAVEKAAQGAKNILSGMAADTWALAKKARPFRIIHHEDESWILEMFGKAICAGFKNVVIDTFRNGDKAWEAMMRDAPDLLITDLLNDNGADIKHVLGMDGLTILRLLEEEKVKFPILLTSGMFGENDEEKHIVRNKWPNLNISLLKKPFTSEQFCAELSKHLGQIDASSKQAFSAAWTETLAEYRGHHPKQGEHPLNIVLVDDEDWFLNMVDVAIHDQYKHVATVKFQDKNKAWQELQQADPDLLITDDKMSDKPGLNGADLVRRLVERKVVYPIIVVSGWPPTEQRVREYARLKPNISFLRKPFTSGQLYDELTKHLRLESKSARPEARPSAENAEAMYQTFHDYRTSKRYADARRSLHRAAEMGHTLAMYKCAEYYFGDELVPEFPQDKRQAFYWFRKAAEQGHAWAQIFTAAAYRSNFFGKDIVSQDLSEAYKWMKLAAEQGHYVGISSLSRLSSIMSSEQLQEGERRYREFLSSKK